MKVHNLPIAREGYPFILFGLGLALILWLLGRPLFSFLLLALTLFLIYFFRDPKRTTPRGGQEVIAPADGKIVSIDECFEGRYLHTKVFKIGIFMSLWDVHINRVPLDGTILSIFYNPGKFLAAFTEKASERNEHNAVLLKSTNGRKILMVQIAGIIARRIVCWIKAGEQVIKGQRFGMICFGSRVDIYVPVDTMLKVKVGEHVKGGETILGYIT